MGPSEEELCRDLRVTPVQMGRLLPIRLDLYRRRELPKKSGNGKREIFEPCPFLKRVQRKLHKLLRDSISLSIACHGGVPGCSPARNALLHAEQRWIARIDISDFFPSVTTLHIQDALLREGWDKRVSRVVAALVTLDGRLPQGSPTSTFIANLVLKQIDIQVLSLSNKLEVTYSRWVDDHILSGKKTKVLRVTRLLKSLLAEHGFDVSEAKSSLLPNWSKQTVTGYYVNKRRATLGKAYISSVRSELRRLVRFGATRTEKNRLTARLARLKSTHPTKYFKMRETLDLVEIRASLVHGNILTSWKRSKCGDS